MGWIHDQGPDPVPAQLLDRIMYLGVPSTGPDGAYIPPPHDGPQAYLAVQGAQVDEIPTHFHSVEQFQYVVTGSGMIGGRPLEVGVVHYADRFTPYGPLGAGPLGMTYATLRPCHDTGVFVMPAGRHRLADLLAASSRPAEDRRQCTVDLREDRRRDRLFRVDRPGAGGRRISHRGHRGVGARRGSTRHGRRERGLRLGGARSGRRRRGAVRGRVHHVACRRGRRPKPGRRRGCPTGALAVPARHGGVTGEVSPRRRRDRWRSSAGARSSGPSVSRPTEKMSVRTKACTKSSPKAPGSPGRNTAATSSRSARAGSVRGQSPDPLDGLLPRGQGGEPDAKMVIALRLDRQLLDELRIGPAGLVADPPAEPFLERPLLGGHLGDQEHLVAEDPHAGDAVAHLAPQGDQGPSGQFPFARSMDEFGVVEGAGRLRVGHLPRVVKGGLGRRRGESGAAAPLAVTDVRR